MIVPRITASIWGPPKSGKTWLALSFPEPIVAIEVGETGIEDVLYMLPDKKVTHIPLTLRSLAPTLSDHEGLLADFDEQLQKIVEADYATLVIDSTSRLWRSIRVVMTEQAFQENVRKKRNRADYELANDYMEQVIQVARQNRAMNIVLVHRHRDKFLVDEAGQLKETGEIESRDYRGLENMVQVMVRTGRGPIFDPKDKETKQGFVHLIELCRFNPALEGTKIPYLDYDRLVGRLFGGG